MMDLCDNCDEPVEIVVLDDITRALRHSDGYFRCVSGATFADIGWSHEMADVLQGPE